MSYQYCPTCSMYKADMTPMSVDELKTYFGPVEAHYGTGAQAYRLAALKWNESSYQGVTVLDKDGRSQSGVEVVYRLADGGDVQKAVTNSSGTVAFQQPGTAKYNVPSELGPMAVFIKDQDSVIRCGSVNVKNANDRHLDVVFRMGAQNEYDPGGTTPPPTQPPPTQPPPTGPGEVEIIDLQGNVSSWAWMESVFGQCIAIEPKGNWECYRLLAKTGPSSIVVTVRDSAGQPVPGKGVLWTWPDGSTHGITDGAGAVGFAMGHGSYYHPENGECGVHTITCDDGDTVHKLGMLGGTEHDHMEPWYRPRSGGPPTQPPPTQPPPGNGSDCEDCYAALEAIKAIVDKYYWG